MTRRCPAMTYREYREKYAWSLNSYGEYFCGLCEEWIGLTDRWAHFKAEHRYAKDEARVDRPFHYSASVIDERTKTFFTITVKNNRMTIAPLGDVPFECFMRLYHVVTKFDPYATMRGCEEEATQR